jgi:hypothetical protein
MLRAIVAQARRRAGRSLALVLGVLIATTGFTVLTASTVTSRLQVTHEVEANFRGAYDVLVRPRGTRLDRETSAGLVRPNFLSDEFGGITLAQVDRIRSVVAWRSPRRSR